ncbi:hypothetical protein [Wolbachia endosymbiont of Cantharis cryptica]
MLENSKRSMQIVEIGDNLRAEASSIEHCWQELTAARKFLLDNCIRLLA